MPWTWSVVPKYMPPRGHSLLFHPWDRLSFVQIIQMSMTAPRLARQRRRSENSAQEPEPHYIGTLMLIS